MSLTQAILLPVPVPHCIPVHPSSQVQVSGAVQVPPFWQGLVQMAAVGEGGMIVHEQKIEQQNANINKTQQQINFFTIFV